MPSELSLPLSNAHNEKASSNFQNKGQLSPNSEDNVDAPESVNRPVKLNSAVFIGMAVGFGIFLIFGMSLQRLVGDSMLDGRWSRLAFLAAGPFLFLAGLFFFQAIFGNLFQVIGPIGSYNENSRFYSPKRPSLRRAYRDGFEPPHVTIQMPVYKEGLEGVIIKTIRSLQAAISYYESYGGMFTGGCFSDVATRAG